MCQQAVEGNASHMTHKRLGAFFDQPSLVKSKDMPGHQDSAKCPVLWLTIFPPIRILKERLLHTGLSP